MRFVRPGGFGELVCVIRPAVDRGDAEIRVAPGLESVLVAVLPGAGLFLRNAPSDWCACACATGREDSRRKRVGDITKVGGSQRGVRIVLEIDIRLGTIQVTHARRVLVLSHQGCSCVYARS